MLPDKHHTHMQNVCGVQQYINHQLLIPVGPCVGVWMKFWMEKRKEAEWGQWSEEGGQKVPYEGGIRKSLWITIEKQNSSGFIMWQKKQIQEKQLL